MKRLYTLLIICTIALSAMAQMEDPVHFKSQLKKTGDAEAELLFDGKIDAGWHVYSYRLGNAGPTEAALHINKMDGAELVGKLTHRGKEITNYDMAFDATLRYFESYVTFVQKIKFTKPQYVIDCYLEYGACNDQMCMPPANVELKAAGKANIKSNDEEDQTEKEKTNAGDSIRSATDMSDTATVQQIPISPKNIATALPSADNSQDVSLWYTFFAGLLGGLLALLTPCVWPIIPMTVSFFLKRNKNRAKAVKEAILYGLSIIVIYVSLGVIVTLIAGPNALNALSTNAWFNIFFALLLIVFAASFFGAFELTLPSSWANKVDEKSERTTGILSIFLMAFTLALVSFSCTGPIIGFLLVAVSTQGSLLSPTIGMLGFAVGLAIPFALFALFPSLLKSAPKSGGWMNTIKVTLGFIELAFALKFLSVADLAYGWRLLDREVFLSLWIAIFGLLSAYLIGWIRFPHDDTTRQHTPVAQFFLGLIALAFTIYMVPGLWGAPLKAISAFTPPMFTQDFQLGKTPVEAAFNDYDAGMAYAKQQDKPVIIDFTGFGCVNCRKMEAAVWTDPTVAKLLTNDYVLISLYVDDKTPLKEPVVVNMNGKQRTLRTVGDKWSHLQASMFGANTQPFYVLLSPQEQLLNDIRSYDEDIAAYTQWLRNGLKNYQSSIKN